MTAPTPLALLKVPMDAIVAPTDVTAGSPYGGTQLGMVGRVVARDLELYEQYAGEEYGETPVEGLDVGSRIVVVTELRGWDATAVANIWPGASTGSVLLGPLSAVTFTTRIGTRHTDRAVKLLLAPRDDPAREPGIYLPRAVPVLADVELANGREEERVMRVAWLGYPDGTGRVYQAGLVEDFTLTV